MAQLPLGAMCALLALLFLTVFAARAPIPPRPHQRPHPCTRTSSYSVERALHNRPAPRGHVRPIRGAQAVHYPKKYVPLGIAYAKKKFVEHEVYDK